MTQELRLRLMFAALCLLWGMTWIAMKLGTAVVPPALFGGLRWTAAGLIMLAGLRLRAPLRLPWHLAGRIALVAVLLISINQLLMLYSLRLVGSGLAAVINCALSPLTLVGFAVAMGQERLTRRVIGAMALGVLGILMLFGPAALEGRLDGLVLVGAIGVMLGTVAYSAASVLARPLMRTVSPLVLAAVVNLTGGVMLLAVSLAVEPGAWGALHLRWGLTPWLAWLFLVGPAALGASTIFLILVRDWGAGRAGSYAFVSPIVAVLIGLLVSGEALHLSDAAGMALMLGAAWVALRRA
jgi:drug/metabolite transporter (DMT)-like permease